MSEVFHQAFIEVDEKGAEAAAATLAIGVLDGHGPIAAERPPVVRVDRPFLLAVQHVASGVCLLLGWVGDPR
ncbi:MAG: hypothetical protein E6Q92_10415 [Burkholderiaceae bacterium]|nr:MAG: hypothetical protein E6Q92_10415 [Burkholderiaceae bacterium]